MPRVFFAGHKGKLEANVRSTVNGVELAYDDTGIGIPVVFIHGFPLNRSLWAPQASGGGWRTIAPDIRGHGESATAAGPFSMDLFADDTRSLLDKLGIERAVIVGLSMGGYVAYAFYRRYPERVRSLVLANTRAGADSAEAAAGRLALADRVLSEGPQPVVDAMHAKMFADGIIPEQLGDEVRAMMLNTASATIAADLRALATRLDSTPILRAIRVPTLVIHGERDVLIPPADAIYQADRIPGCRLVMITGAGHLSNLEQPEEFNQAISVFLREIGDD